MIDTETIIEHFDFASKLPRIIDELGWSVLKEGLVVHNIDGLPHDSLLEKKEDLEQYIWSITKADILFFDAKKNHVHFKLDLWKHAGYPGGSTSQYIGRVSIIMETFAFILIAAKYLK